MGVAPGASVGKACPSENSTAESKARSSDPSRGMDPDIATGECDGFRLSHYYYCWVWWYDRTRNFDRPVHVMFMEREREPTEPTAETMSEAARGQNWGYCFRTVAECHWDPAISMQQ